MKLTRTLHFPAWLFNVIPLVNVIFLVVVFFAISSRFVLQPGLAVTLPASSFTLEPREGAQIVSITSSPAPAIYYHDQRVTFEELRQRLDELSHHVTKSGLKERSIIIKGDKDTPYDLIVKITDTALHLGFSVVLATSAERR
jgi:biopolymer transport protein ExbD